MADQHWPANYIIEDMKGQQPTHLQMKGTTMPLYAVMSVEDSDMLYVQVVLL